MIGLNFISCQAEPVEAVVIYNLKLAFDKLGLTRSDISIKIVECVFPTIYARSIKKLLPMAKKNDGNFGN
jgi:hypothetical protein